MDRDRRLTGYLRGQTDNVVAPPGFELNNPWRVGLVSTFTRLMLIAYRWKVVSFKLHGWRYPIRSVGESKHYTLGSVRR